MSNHAHLRPGHGPSRGAIPNAYPRGKRPLYRRDIREVRERVLDDPNVKKAMAEAENAQ
jgi:hypothetical protein